MLRVSLVLGVLFALLWGMNVLWRRFTQPPPPPPGPKKVKIIIAERDIPAHTVITAMMLREEERMPSEAPPHTFRRIDDVINRVAKVDIYRGTPVLEDDVSEPINIEGLSVLIPDGYVAATLPINNEALYRILKTGDHIRVVATFGGLLTQTLVEDAVVLGVDTQVMNIELAQRGQPSQQEGKGKEQPQPPPSLRVLLILVRPEEAERIALAMAQPQITIDFTLLPAEPPVPTPPPPEIEGVQRKPKRGITAAELHPAVARIVAKEAGMEPEEVEDILGIKLPGARKEVQPVDPSVIAAQLRGQLLADILPQLREMRGEQMRTVEALQAIQEQTREMVTRSELEEVVQEMDKRIASVEEMVKQPTMGGTQMPAGEGDKRGTVVIFLGDREVRAKVGEPVKLPSEAGPSL